MPSRDNSDPLPSASASAVINGKHTDVACASFADRNVVVVTQFKKLGTLITVTLNQSQHMAGAMPTFQTKVIMGIDEQEIHVFARAISETILNLSKSKETSSPLPQAPQFKPLLCTLAICDPTPEVLAEVCHLVKSCNVWCAA